jgi:hypothetical protein
MKELRTHNLRLLRLLESNYERIAARLEQDFGVQVLQDMKSFTDAHNIKLFLKHTYGKTVNMTDLRKNHRSVYRALPCREIVQEWGFTLTYDGIFTEEMLVAELQRTGQIDEELYGKVAYRARKVGLSVREYMGKLGFPNHEVDIKEITKLREKHKLTYRQIELITGVPKSSAQKYYHRGKQYEKS